MIHLLARRDQSTYQIEQETQIWMQMCDAQVNMQINMQRHVDKFGMQEQNM